MKISVASDHAGYELKRYVIECLVDKGFEIEDFGAYDANPVDYIDTGLSAVQDVVLGRSDCGILICGTGQGMSIIANKVKGIRAALCHTVEFARLAREHNDANVLVLAGRYIGEELVMEIIETFLHTVFSNEERHLVRINKIKEYEKLHCHCEDA